MPATLEQKWWKNAVIYQVYPRSFQDSNGDGIGDLPGILSRLDYIAGLGVDTVWINPVYTSPGVDNGYDISDYKTIQPEYGTMNDLQRLIDRLHEKKMRLIMDMVINHTSAEHEWFRQARTGRDNPYYSFYHWWPEEKGEPPYRCGFFDDAGQGWAWNEATRSWYLHYFSPEQPDLNWEDPAVRREIYSLLRWWLDKGIDGFRLDAICFISKDTAFPEITPQILKDRYLNDWGRYYASGPRLHEYLQEMHREVWSKYDAVTIGEASGVLSGEAPLFVGEDRKELDMLYHFEGIMIGYLPGEFKKMAPGGYSIREWKDIYTRWDAAFEGNGWGTLYLGNHDQPRMLSHFGDDNEPLRQASARMLFTFLLTMRATPFIYNGDEIGMTNIRFTRIEDYQDIETRRLYRKLQDSGGDVEGFLKDQQLAARDNGRTPFQWNDGPGAGFTTGQPWLKINPNHSVINRDRQEKDPESILNYVRRLIRLRKAYPALVEGRYELLAPDHPTVYAYTRSQGGLTFLVLLNFTGDVAEFDFPLSVPVGKQSVINNYSGIEGTDRGLRLKPYQSLVFICGAMRTLLLIAMLFVTGRAAAQTVSTADSIIREQQMTAEDRWYKNDVFYNLDVRTFQDSDGDGIGDFRGLTARLRYLKSLGVDALWLAPFQPSPHRDDGYDISDYYGIDSSCGTPGDFAEFMYQAHSLGFRVIMDMVLAHSSDEHPWFRQAIADTASFRHAWYVWSTDRPANQHKGMAFPGVQKEIWTYNRQAGAWYFHRFYDFQPHLNFVNPQVQDEGQRVLGYWMAQGMDGFRLDAVPFIVEIPNKTSDKMGHQLSLVPAMRQFVQWRKGDVLLLGEANVMPEENSQYFGKTGEGLNMMFNFYGNQYLFYGLATGDIRLFRRALTDTRDIPAAASWGWFLRNHDEIDLGRLTDQQREEVYSRFGPDRNMQLYDRGIRRRLAPMLHNLAELKMAYSLLFSLPGTPVIRYGEELGMGDDLDLKERLSVRTPMQWTHAINAGFTTGRSFRPLIDKGNYGYNRVNVEDEEQDTASLLNHIRKMIELRKNCPEIGLGHWSIPDSTLPQVLVMRYDYQGRSLLFLHNFSSRPQQVHLTLAGPDQGLRDLITGVETQGPDRLISLAGYGYKWFRIIPSPVIQNTGGRSYHR